MRQKLTRQGHELALYRLSDTHGVGVQNVRPHTWDGFRLLSGEVKVYVKTAETGAKRHQGFCPVCGPLIYSTSDTSGPKVYAIRTGTLASVTNSSQERRFGAGRADLDQQYRRHSKNGNARKDEFSLTGFANLTERVLGHVKESG